MFNLFSKSIFVLFISLIAIQSFAQDYSVAIIIKNQPEVPIVFGAVKGDDFIAIDTSFAEKEVVRFTIPDSAHVGLYRILLGQTKYAKVMKEAPQQLEFIFNNEDVTLETDFNSPETETRVIQSEENEIWFEFKAKEQYLKKQIKELEQEVNYYWATDNKEKAIKTATEYNQLQMENDLFIKGIVKSNKGRFAAKLINAFREPLLDGYLTENQRKELFKKEYLNTLDFTDEALLYSEVYTDRVFKYLISYNKKGLTTEQREQEYIKAVDVILSATNKNEKIYEFILKYLVHGFEVLRLENVIVYIADNYSGTTCQTDEYSTLERKLAERKMKIGTSVSDFTLNNINGNSITFTEVMAERNIILFWASWCPHCTEMLPQLKQWHKQFAKNECTIFAISLDTSKEEWKKKVTEVGVESWYNLSDLEEWDGRVAIEYNVYATPTFFVIDKNLQIIGKADSFSELINLDIFK